MYRELQGVLEAMRCLTNLTLICVFQLVCVCPAHSQAACQDEKGCLKVRIRLNGDALPLPDSVTFIWPGGERAVPSKNSEFRIPSELPSGKMLSLRLPAGESLLSIPGILPDWLNYPWDIELEDKQFPNGRGILSGRKAKGSCVVTIHGGEPETSLIISNCRAKLRRKLAGGPGLVF